MKNCILTPTYEGHFKYIKEYLSSFYKYVVDFQDITICFTLSSNYEKEAFNRIISPYIDILNIEVYIFDEIIKSFGIEEDTEVLLKKYGHTSYQMLKKMYSMLYIPAERFFVLDSEAVWIKPTKMLDLFDSFYSNPFVIVSDFETRRITDDCLKDHFDTTNYILGYSMKKMPFEHFVWFYTKDIIRAVTEKYGSPYDMMIKVYDWEMATKGKSVGLMETMLLLNYIYENASSLGYTIIDVETELNKYLGDRKFESYIKEFFKTTKGCQLGLLEFPCDRLNKDNLEGLSSLFNSNHIFITRCDVVSLMNLQKIKIFFHKGNICILAVGQDHIFLPNIGKTEVISRLYNGTKNHLKLIIKQILGV